MCPTDDHACRRFLLAAPSAGGDGELASAGGFAGGEDVLSVAGVDDGGAVGIAHGDYHTGLVMEHKSRISLQTEQPRCRS
jgi:hypothetical protein